MWNLLTGNRFAQRVCTSWEAGLKMIMAGARNYQEKHPDLSFREALELSLIQTRGPWMDNPALIDDLRKDLDGYERNGRLPETTLSIQEAVHMNFYDRGPNHAAPPEEQMVRHAASIENHYVNGPALRDIYRDTVEELGMKPE